MRKAVAMLLVGIGVLWAPATAMGAARGLGPRALKRALTKDLSEVDGVHGAYVVDLTSKRTLFHLQASTGRMPASVQKLYTTSTALLRLGGSAVFTTSVLGTGLLTRSGTWRGTLYLRGGGDPTFGGVNFDEAAYGTGATVRTLARGLYRAGVRRVSGRMVGDESRFDSLRGTPATGFAPSFYVEGQLSALAYDRGFSNRKWTAFQRNPPLYAARKFAAALRANGVSVPTNIPISRTGTLTDEMRGTRAQGNCRGKTGTLSDVASLVGYCTARDGHSLAFAFLLNRLSNADTGHAVEAKMAVALANYTG